jgi:23S rRNA (pseudouridine1915-N3)-methyltransferase
LSPFGYAQDNSYMFKIKIIALGKFKEKAYKELEAEFLKRLSPFAKIKVVELPEIGYGKNQDLEKIKQQEAEKIIKQLPKDGVVILLEEKGTLRSSNDFAVFLERIGGLGKELVFVIGSGIGLHQSLHQYSNYSISLSPLTFPHNLARIILHEQLYRACTILVGKQYHK